MVDAARILRAGYNPACRFVRAGGKPCGGFQPHDHGGKDYQTPPLVRTAEDMFDEAVARWHDKGQPTGLQPAVDYVKQLKAEAHLRWNSIITLKWLRA